MLTPEQIQAAKRVPLVDYLASLGHYPITSTGRELAYRSPWTQEQTPSFFVHPGKNVFTDYSGQQSGDVVRLVQHLTGCSFPVAVQFLLSFDGSSQAPAFSFSGPLPDTTRNVPTLTVTDVRPLTHPALLGYMADRRIPEGLALKYCRQVHYQQRAGQFFGVVFANDVGGWELRTQRFKGSSAPKGISTFEVAGSNRICLFEGFFDFLSALTWYGLARPRYTSIVLNSTANIKQALPGLKASAQINCFLDTDKAGRALVERLQREGLPVVDYSTVYAGRKDFNEMLCEK